MIGYTKTVVCCGIFPLFSLINLKLLWALLKFVECVCSAMHFAWGYILCSLHYVFSLPSPYPLYLLAYTHTTMTPHSNAVALGVYLYGILSNFTSKVQRT